MNKNKCLEDKFIVKFMFTISESTTLMFKFGIGVPGAIFSGIEIKKSRLLKIGGSSLTS